MGLAHLTTASEPGLGARDQGRRGRRARDSPRGGAGDAESSSALVADPDRARARRAGRDGLGPLGSRSSGGRARLRPSPPLRTLARGLDRDVRVHRLPDP